MDLKEVVKKLTNVNIKTPFINKKDTGGFKVAVSSGIYYAARSDEINTLVKKTGYALTRGAGAVEIASDIPHEINFSEGKEIRYISEKMGVDMLLHGDLQAPLELPDRTEWLITQNKLEKSVKSGIYGGCKYVNFHSCLREWLELFTYAGQRLEIVMCDHFGRAIGKHIFKDEADGKPQNGKKLRDWFILEPNVVNKNDFAMKWAQAILHPKEYETLQREIEVEVTNNYLEEIVDRADEGQLVIITNRLSNQINEEAFAEGAREGLNQNQINERAAAKFNELNNNKNRVKERLKNLSRNEKQRIVDEGIIPGYDYNRFSKILQEEFRKEIRKRVSNVLKDGRDWYIEDRIGSLEDAYLIMAHHLMFNQDPLWITSAKMYEDVLRNFGYDINNPPLDLIVDPTTQNGEQITYSWLDKALKQARDVPNEYAIGLKEFYYGVVSAKYLQGHVIELAKWMILKEGGLRSIISREIDSVNPSNKENEKKKLFEVLEDFVITFEVPDARNPEFGGRYMLWRPKQILSAVMHTREELKKIKNPYHDKIFMIIDWEHVATQGVDPFDETEDLVNVTKNKLGIDVGDYIIGIHANYPSPLQPHKPIEIADRIVIYELLWKVRKVGLGRNHVVYLLFERGGGEDPFRGSVIALRTIADYLVRDTPPDNLPETFFAISEGTRDYARQRVHIFQHAFEPLKGELKVPEEEHTLLSSATIRAGKRPEEWLKEELR